MPPTYRAADRDEMNFQTGTSPISTTQNPDASRCKLLISVRSLQEAQTALTAGVSWIDLKEPDAGPLGAPSAEVASQVANLLRTHPLRSVALGEFPTLDFAKALELARLFPVVKLGLSGVRPRATTATDAELPHSQNQPQWESDIAVPHVQTLIDLSKRVAEVGSQLVPVLYTDWATCEGISPLEWLRLCELTSARFALVDTFHKDGKSLLDHMSVGELSGFAARLRDNDCGLVLAGSLKLEHLESLSNLPLKAIGVRGAVCEGARESSISAAKLSHWLSHRKFVQPPQIAARTD